MEEILRHIAISLGPSYAASCVAINTQEQVAWDDFKRLNKVMLFLQENYRVRVGKYKKDHKWVWSSDGAEQIERKIQELFGLVK